MKKALFVIGEITGAIRLLIAIVSLTVAFCVGADFERKQHTLKDAVGDNSKRGEEPFDIFKTNESKTKARIGF